MLRNADVFELVTFDKNVKKLEKDLKKLKLVSNVDTKEKIDDILSLISNFELSMLECAEMALDLLEDLDKDGVEKLVC